MATIRYFDDAIKKTRKKFLALTITKKMLLGFLPLFILTVLMASYALTSLTRLNKINGSIVDVDIPLMQAADTMIDRLYDQEIHGNLFVLLKTAPNKELFENAGVAFKEQVEILGGLAGRDAQDVDRLNTLHTDYEKIFIDWFEAEEDPESVSGEFEIRIEEKQVELKGLIEDISGAASSGLTDKSLAASLIGSTSSKIFAVFCIFSILIGFIAAYVITRNISGTIIRLKNATQEICIGIQEVNTIFHSRRNFKL